YAAPPNGVGLSSSVGKAARAPWIKSLRRYLLPRLLIPTNRGLPPVVTCRGTKPSQAAKSRSRANLSPWPIAATNPEALEDKPSKPDRVWNRIPDDIRQRVVMMAFEQPELSPRELATRFTERLGIISLP